MGLKNNLRIGIGIIFVVTLFIGCSTKIVSIKKETGHLNLEAPQIKQAPQTGKVLGIVDPQFHYKEYNDEIDDNTISFRNSYTFSPSKYFKKYYEDRLKRALETSIQTILLKKGFKLQGPYATFDDITYQDKKKMYLAVIPQVNLDIKKVVNEKRCDIVYYTEKGTIYFGGDIIVTLEEPLTRQIFMKKRINLSDVNIAEPYIIQYKVGQCPPYINTSSVKIPKYLVNNVDKAMTDGINKFYKYAVNKINKYLDREEILSYQKGVEQLKKLKRF